MNYLDYLMTHTYDELPAAVRREIDRSDYQEHRAAALSLGASATDELPQQLAAAFAAVTAKESTSVIAGASTGRGARVPGKGPSSKERRRWYLATVAGWLLFAVAAAALLLREPAETIVYREIAGPERIVAKTDTLRIPEVRTVYHLRTVRDTVYQPLPVVEYVTVRDTVYQPILSATEPSPPVSGSRSLAGSGRVLQFLVGAE